MYDQPRLVIKTLLILYLIISSLCLALTDVSLVIPMEPWTGCGLDRYGEMLTIQGDPGQ